MSASRFAPDGQPTSDVPSEALPLGTYGSFTVSLERVSESTPFSGS